MLEEINIVDNKNFGNNEKYINKIIFWIKNYKRRVNSILCIKGPKGCGKTEMINYICRDNNYKIKKINFEDLNNKLKTSKNQKKEIEIYLNNLVNTYDIFSSLMGIEFKNIIIINKNEMVNFSKYKQQIINILKINNALKICPIILIYDNLYNKDCENIEKVGTEIIYMEEPDYNTIFNYLNKYCKNNNILIEKDVIDKFIKDTTHNFNKIKISFKNFILLYKNKIINHQQININDYNDYKNIINDVELTHNIYTTTNEIFTKYKNIKSVNKLFSYETTIIPLMVQQFFDESFIINLDENYTDENLPPYYNNDINKKILKYYKEAINNISYGNMFDNYIHNEQKWKLIGYYSYFSTSSISYYINKINVEKLKINSHPNNYPKDLNRSSMMKLNYSHIKTMYNHFNIISVNNYLYLINIFFQLCINANSNPTILKEFCKYYKLSSTDFEKIIKITKLIPDNDKKKYFNNVIKNIIDGKNKLKSKPSKPSKSSKLPK